MRIRILTKTESSTELIEWLENRNSVIILDNDYKKIREEILDIYKHVLKSVNNIDSKTKKEYNIDYHFAVALYEYFNKQEWFTLRLASNDGFWRYLAIKVLPDIVFERWNDSHEHYYKKTTRIWFRSLWWYVHLSWQGDAKSTLDLLGCECFTTDTILNLVERSGRKGTYIDLYRNIMKFYSTIPLDVIREYNKKLDNETSLFRVIMKVNTSKTMVVEPTLYDGGVKEYAKSLFRDLGISID